MCACICVCLFVVLGSGTMEEGTMVCASYLELIHMESPHGSGILCSGRGLRVKGNRACRS